MPTYLINAGSKQPLSRIYGCWNSGMEEDEARAHIIKRFGAEYEPEFNHVWTNLEAEFGGGCIPVSPRRTDAQLLRDMEEETSPMHKQHKRAYLDWKGVTGKGARLREILANEGDRA